MKEIEALNRLYEKEFRNVPFSERIIFLPHCLRSRECKAETCAEGVRCINCGKCNIGLFKKEAEELGYHIFIVPGFSMVKKIIGEYKPKAVLGVSCLNELNKAKDEVNGKKIILQGLALLKDGCVDTEADWDKIRKITNLK